MPLTVAGVDVLLARTGYTGEDGFRAVPNENAVELWDKLAAAGEAFWYDSLPAWPLVTFPAS